VSEPWKVIIIGGGFGGLRAAQALASRSVDVTLIDRRNHHLFQPLLYQVATGSLSPERSHRRCAASSAIRRTRRFFSATSWTSIPCRSAFCSRTAQAFPTIP
jgi:NADH dehydrogenase FAD-containing subunit